MISVAGSGARPRSPLASEPALRGAVANNSGVSVSMIKAVFVRPLKTNHPCGQQSRRCDYECEKFLPIRPRIHRPHQPQSSSGLARHPWGTLRRRVGAIRTFAPHTQQSRRPCVKPTALPSPHAAQPWERAARGSNRRTCSRKCPARPKKHTTSPAHFLSLTGCSRERPNQLSLDGLLNVLW